MLNEVGAKRVCVVGAGTMGSGIAAHLANLGFDVTLLDATQQTVTDAFERARNARPPHFYTPDTSNRIRLGNTTDNLHWVSEADWVCEAIVERPDAKRALYTALEPHLRPDAMISTNTSGLEISILSVGRSDLFRQRFMGTHFFNPPRYLKLLELIPTPESDPLLVTAMSQFLEEFVGRRVVVAKDTPGFIANRYGMWCMYQAIHVAERLHLSVEEVDAITGTFMGRPKSASFRLCDIVGLDVMRDIANNLISRCPTDPNINALTPPNSMIQLLARGWIGEKAGHGYYRREGKELLTLDFATYAYRQKRDVAFPSLSQVERLPLGERLRQALDLRDEVGEYLRHYLVPSLRYANYLKEEISHSVLDFDRVMEWGFGWEMGPFAMIDAIGAERLGIDAKPFYQGNSYRGFDGSYISIPSQPEYVSLPDFPIVSQGETFVLRDLGDGVGAICLTTKMGVISPAMVEELITFLEKSDLSRFVLTSEARSFSAGFDLRFFSDAIAGQRYGAIDLALQRLQHLGELLESRSCVAAVYGHCLGAGLELALSCSHIVAAAETQIGLPESKVGLIPGGRGVTLLRNYNQHTSKRLCEVAMTITRGEVAPTPDHARTLGYLRATDVTVYHPDRLLYEAKRIALTAIPVARPAWATMVGPLVGMIDRELDQAGARGDLTEFDLTLGHKIKQIFARSDTYGESLAKERVEFIDLCGRALTHQRIRHMLDNGKPVKN
ncbi:3-hydroxyacyl-CoA dehydrogenase/enoyl-CoA hydratase family protein [Fimbriimonas ginsengisoli]|uniref:Enoyl-CoA hydratase/3,2-trans-enoyl-CoA isomerase/3-hydroxyacyl-CoA dehydrogenase n=1 Tax=Fimbriimonas ginsengisoli Gsoil 348 TaxID=661478 RepID=A0A068NWA3_FIMGI|nr:3-hydroxyacyl-CoA dehydrogenase/enoyl-CoA hydratase family protein [Fimbriimonas ginsengisoli]AIE87627.1 enoyl-CoA hydratase/3,2-trans-enoyl-CoA isomerase/3-hydroxyacyl-CoA dehydrogenase [Fimbriimonas ginsengisoli Gsoil 348]